MLAVAVDADGQSRSSGKIREQQRQKQQQIKETDKKIRANSAAVEQRLNQLSLVEGEIAVCNKKIRRLRVSADSVYRAMRSVNDSVKALDDRVTLLKDKYATALRHMQMRKSAMGDLAFLFASESFVQAYRRYRSLQQFARWRQRKADEISEMKKSLEEKRAHLETLRAASAAALAALNKERKNLEDKQHENERLIADLRKEGGKLKKIMDRRRREAEALDKELDRVIAQEIKKQKEEEARKEAERLKREEEERLLAEKRKAEEEAKAKALAEQQAAAKKQTKKDSQARTPKNKPAENETVKKDNEVAKTEPAKSAKPEAGKQPAVKPAQGNKTAAAPMPQLTGSFESNKGNLPFPVDGNYTIVKKFGRQRHPKLPKVETNNSGIDVETSQGATVRVVFDGEVSQIFRLSGYNNVVVVRHGEYVTVYANLDRLTVRKGDVVKGGQAIGSVSVDAADNNRSVLHFEVRRETEKRNPEEWVKVRQ